MSDIQATKYGLLIKAKGLKQAIKQIAFLLEETHQELARIDEELSRANAFGPPYIRGVIPAAPIRMEELQVGKKYIVAGGSGVYTFVFRGREDEEVAERLTFEKRLYPFGAGGFISADDKNEQLEHKIGGSLDELKRHLG